MAIDLDRYPQDLVDAVGEAISVPADRTAARRPTAREVLSTLEARGHEVRAARAATPTGAADAASAGSEAPAPGLPGLMASFESHLSAAREGAEGAERRAG